MSSPRRRSVPEEPLGIVISGGQRDEVAPRLVAYIWGVSSVANPDNSTQTVEPPSA